MSPAVVTDRRPAGQRRQFWALYRSFLFRVIDLELLSVSGEVRNLLAQFASLLAAYSFVLALFTLSNFAESPASHSILLVSAWGIEEFLISTTLTVAGLFAVLAWNAVLPDHRDSLVLDPLPLRTRTIFSAKGAAAATALAISIIAINIFTGIGFSISGRSRRWEHRGRYSVLICLLDRHGCRRSVHLHFYFRCPKCRRILQLSVFPAHLRLPAAIGVFHHSGAFLPHPASGNSFGAGVSGQSASACIPAFILVLGIVP